MKSTPVNENGSSFTLKGGSGGSAWRALTSKFLHVVVKYLNRLLDRNSVKLWSSEARNSEISCVAISNGVSASLATSFWICCVRYSRSLRGTHLPVANHWHQFCRVWGGRLEKAKCQAPIHECIKHQEPPLAWMLPWTILSSSTHSTSATLAMQHPHGVRLQQ